ncbi:N-acetylated-alpha-linked acidic dipeptidase 2-like isoform X1 [Centruroides vittatus]|uniref:N-acetylated-alpha-linked acidic dipeptidase 2-like isoform X1 n=2 Tax=Centruroides vittatus TaxID=120091 RepID=UPI0035103147
MLLTLSSATIILMNAFEEMVATSRALGACVITGIVTLILGLLIGHYAIKPSPPRLKKPPRKPYDEPVVGLYYPSVEDNVIKTFLNDVDEVRIESNLRELSKKAHIAATPRDEELAELIRRRWKDEGFDYVEKKYYDILLSYPTKEHNRVCIVNRHYQCQYEAANREVVVDEQDTYAYAFNGFSPPGDVTAEPVYVNYGRVEDFDELENLGVNVSGKICIARYGKIFRGNKVKNAEERGAIGVVMFLDPSEVALNGTDAKYVYPNSWWMPGDAMQRGSVYVGNGDPLTPGYPSTDSVYRYDINETVLPKIPAQPIGYNDARHIMSLMAGPMAPANWTGGLNITYHLGPGFNSENAEKMLRIEVNNEYKRMKSSNVIGLIEGSEEPDRYVLIGNHRDAWGYGAVDPSSGTAQLLEVARLFGTLHRNGWKPRRSIVFCSWGAEEYGLIGSTEWVEEHRHALMEQAVGYINIDICVSGDVFNPAASPVLAEILRNATKLISDPSNPEKTMYEVWKDHVNKTDTSYNPPVKTLGSGTDHAPFSFFAGVPAVDITWSPDKKKYPISGYPPYHTAYETFEMVKNFIDPQFSRHKKCAQLSGILTHMIADSTIIPYDLEEMAKKLKSVIENFEVSGISDKLNKIGISLDLLKTALDEFQQQTEIWHMKLSQIELEDAIKVRAANDRMMQMERVFIKPDGIPLRSDYRNVAFAPSQFDQYSSNGFPAVMDLLYGYDKLPTEEMEERKKLIERHISDLTVIVDMATSFLKTHPLL